MWAKLLSLATGLSWQTYIIAAVGLLIGTNIWTASKVHEYVESKCQSILLQQKVRVIEREKEVLVLDQKTLTEATGRAYQQGRQDTLRQQRIENVIKNDPTATTRQCLTPDELREWNDANTGVEIHDDSGKVSTTAELQIDLSTGTRWDTSEPLS